MIETHKSTENPPLQENQTKDYYENLISFIRSRLNVIGTSLYLLEKDISGNLFLDTKYVKKINEEIESIRRLINL